MGVILFELLTGERPFRAERDQKLLMQQILNAAPPPLSQLNSRVPADLDQELHRFLHGEPIHSRPITPRSTVRRFTPPLQSSIAGR